MENAYTETMLKDMNKTQLLEIAKSNEIKADKNIKNEELIALILEKGCKIPDDGTGGEVNGDADVKTDDDNGDEAALECDCLVEDEPEAEPEEDESVPKFSKEQLLKSNWYSHRRDVLMALLDDDKQYSHAAVDRLIGKFMKGKVN